MYKLSEPQLRDIAKLPVWIQSFKDKYPVSISNVAEDFDCPPLPEGYTPEDIEIYYGDDVESEDLFIRRGQVQFFNLDRPINPEVTRVIIDSHYVYIQLEGCVVLDRLGGVKLPQIAIDPENHIPFILSITNS